jgi:hypothetical protein
MKRTKTQKGITLIALIITIVILLILAVVTINEVKGDGIIRYAKNAATDYTAKANEEQILLNSYLDQLNLNNPNGNSGEDEKPTTLTVATWEQDRTTITGKASDGTIVTTLTVGDEIDYDCYTGAEQLTYTATKENTGNYLEEEYGNYNFEPDEKDRIYELNKNIKWIVLGAKDNHVLITTKEVVSAKQTDGLTNLRLILGYGDTWMSGPDPVVGGTVVRELGAFYAQGAHAANGRFIDVEDIKRVTGGATIFTTDLEKSLFSRRLFSK